MHRIIEQTAVLCGMVKTPNPSSHQRNGRTWRISSLSPKRTRAPHLRDEARKETESKAEDAHYAARLRRALAHRDRPRPLLLLSTTVYAVVSRFLREGRAAFDDRKGRGPVALLDKETDERVEELLEEDSPVEHGWLRSPASLEL
jgi:hypothetical protein